MRPLLADAILILHFAFIAFVVVGLVLILVGIFRRWAWIRNIWFRLAHLLAIGLVVAEAWCGIACPLTVWENTLRTTAGERGYAESFVAHWLHVVIFYDFPGWIFTAAYTAFGALVVLTWVIAPPRTAKTRRRGPTG
jgi:multisubunit Na+/H+ antiporter MnhB subunit